MSETETMTTTTINDDDENYDDENDNCHQRSWKSSFPPGTGSWTILLPCSPELLTSFFLHACIYQFFPLATATEVKNSVGKS